MPTRRTKGEGAITQLTNGKFRVRVEIDPVDGKRKWLSATANTKKEAIKKLHELMQQKENHQVLIKETQDTFKYHIVNYLDMKEVMGMKQSSLYRLKNSLEDFGDFFGTIPLPKITKNHVFGLINSWKERRRKQSTIMSYFNTLNGYFSWLTENNIIPSNPASTIHLMNKEPKDKPEVLSYEEHKCLKEKMLSLFKEFLCEKDKWNLSYRMYPIYLLTYETGMREGEVAALQWSDIDFKKATVTVNKTLIYVNMIKIDSPKTAAGYRTIKISQDTLTVLKSLKDVYKTKGCDSNFVFFNNKNGGEPYMPCMLDKTFRQFLKDIGITRRFTFHSIRHTNASLLFHKGVSPAVIAERLGHADVQVTYKIYTHALQDDKDRNSVLIEA